MIERVYSLSPWFKTMNNSHIATENDYGFPVKIPESYLASISSSPEVLSQFLPSHLEHIASGKLDPLEEDACMVIPGVLHKYHGRILLTLTQACAVHCRYCFRRHFDYQHANPFKYLPEIEEYIRHQTSIHEIILSGGDPLMLSNDKLDKVLSRLTQFKHIQTIRLHTRIPIVKSSRIDNYILSLPKKYDQWRWVAVLHINHPREWTTENKQTIQSMHQNQFTLLNQSVLLKNVNDELQTLIKLSHSLWQNNVLPYYLHLFDPVQNAMHFAVKKHEALTLYHELKNYLPGYLVPKLAQEIPKDKHKKCYE